MENTSDKRATEIAVFRFGLIAEVVHLTPGSIEIAAKLREQAQKLHTVPHSSRSHVAVETMRHWLKCYRRGGFEALKPRSRRDTGGTRRLRADVADALCALKDDKPELSVQGLIKHAVAQGMVPADTPLPASTVHRLLSRAGLMHKNAPPPVDRRRFEFEHAKALWMSDVMHGPQVGVGGRVRRKAYLIGFIDDATRLVPFAAFALSENAATFLPQLKGAIMRRGIPQRLYVDNGAAYRSQQLQLVCAKLGITLIHARPYHPQGKGKQERWFRTVRMQFLPMLTPTDTESPTALNARLWAWVEGEYHRTPHRGLAGKTPLDAWAARAAHIAHVGGRADIEDMFLFEQKRRVARDRTVSLEGRIYEVDAVAVGTSVTLRYDQARPEAPVQVYTAEGARLADARVVDVHGNRLVKRQPATPAPLAMREFNAPMTGEVR